SSPMVLPDAHTVVTAIHKLGDKPEFIGDGEVFFAKPNRTELAPIKLRQDWVFGPPARTVNGSAVVVGLHGPYVLRDGALVSHLELPATFAAAAASRTNVFVSTATALVSLDADATVIRRKFAWTDGRLQPPAIGPDGRVYAIAANTLF